MSHHVSKPDTKPPGFSIKATTLTCHSSVPNPGAHWMNGALLPLKHTKRAEPGKTPLQQDMNEKHFPNSTTKCPLNQPKSCKAQSKRVHLHPMVKGRCFGAYLRSRSVLRRLSSSVAGLINIYTPHIRILETCALGEIQNTGRLGTNRPTLGKIIVKLTQTCSQV